MTDMELALSNIAQKVFSNSKWYLYWFHVMHNISEKLDKLELLKKFKKIIKNEFREIHQTTTLEQATEKWTQIKTNIHYCPDAKVLDELKRFIKYCEKVYLRSDRLIRWISIVDHLGQPLEATNNAIENFHGIFQKIGFHYQKNKKLELAVQKFHELFEILEIDLGVASIKNPPSSNPIEKNALQSFFTEMKGLAQYVQNFMHSKLGGKQTKKKDGKFMDAPHTFSSSKKQHSHQKAEKSDLEFESNENSNEKSVITDIENGNYHDNDIFSSSSKSYPSEDGSYYQDSTDFEISIDDQNEQFVHNDAEDYDSFEKETRIPKVDSSLPLRNVVLSKESRNTLEVQEEENMDEVIPSKVHHCPMPKQLKKRSEYQ